MQPPDISNLTIPGGVKVFFDTGSGFRNLGLMTGLDGAPQTEEFKHESNQSGKMRVVKTFSTKEELAFKFKLHEPVADTMRAYWKGGALTLVGEGSAAVVDQKLTLAGELPASVLKYGLSAVTVRQFLDKCFLYDKSALAYLDHSAEADTLAGTPFSTLEEADDALYLGKLTPFTEVYFDFAVEGIYGGVVVEYWDGSAWAAVTGLAGAAAALAADGKMNWDLPADWNTTIVNSSAPMYWIKITATTPWTTPATINCIRQNAVRNTDYIIDPGGVSPSLLVGRIGRLAAGFLADGEEVMVSYTHATWESLKFPLATNAFQEGAARLEVNTPDGNGLRWHLHLYKCQLKPDGDLRMGGEDKKTMDIPMQLEVMDDSARHPDAPYGEWEALSEA